MFGADALNRKFGKQPPREWEALLSHLTDAQLRHGMGTLAKSGAEHIPSLPQFIAMCRQAREFENFGDLPRIAPKMANNWTLTANRHLFAYILKCGALRRYFDEAETKILVAFKNAWAEDMAVDDKGQGIAITAQEAAWADCMERATQAGATGSSRRLAVPGGAYNP
jgi:hypothetical protein